MNQHEVYINRCFELAQLGAGNVAPNPMVGAVLVHDQTIIGEGYHHKYGEAHAEVNAINSVKDKSLLKQSTIYVSLEPCAHFGKTPPCANLIIDHEIPKVVIANRDPFVEVDGKGIEKLKEAGIEVICGVLSKEGRFINRRFFTFHEQKRPYIILKWAETADRFIDYIRNPDSLEAPLKISQKETNKIVHKWRSEEASIMVGRNTVLLDNPSLTTRLWPGKNPLRLVIDPRLEVPKESKLYSDGQPTWVFNALKESSEGEISFKLIENPENFEQEILRHLYEGGIQSVIIEGGANTINRFISANLWDEARVIRGQKRIQDGVIAPKMKGDRAVTDSINGDLIDTYYNT